MLRLVTVVGVLGGASAAIAEPVRMTSDDIKRAMPGALLEIDTPLRIAIPVKVGSDGLMSAEAGALGLTLGATKDRGRWWTEGDKLCMKWFRWFDAKPRCMTLHREGNRVHWAEGSGESGTATITEAAAVVAAATPDKAKRDMRAPPSTLPAEENSAGTTPATDETPPQRFATAALDKIFAPPAPREAEPSMLGVRDDSQPTFAAVEEESTQRAEPSAPTRKQPQAKAPAAAERPPTARKSARRASPAPQEAKPAPVAASFRVAGVSYGDTLNVRSGPSEYHPPVGTISSDGRGVQIIGACRDLWCPIRHGRLTGWVNRFYLTEDNVQRTSARR
jgi:hypothetical protein